jgi:hypothetical protein
MHYQTEICAFKTADNERLHGALLTPADMPSNLAIIFVHGVAMNFYLPPLFKFGQELAARNHHCFIINTRGHDWISRAGSAAGDGEQSKGEIEALAFYLTMRNPKVGEVKAEDLIDNRIMRKLDESGFIDRTYAAHGAKL